MRAVNCSDWKNPPTTSARLMHISGQLGRKAAQMARKPVAISPFQTRVVRKPKRRKIGVVTVFMRNDPMAVEKVMSPLRAAE